jgi:hypothetical protein
MSAATNCTQLYKYIHVAIPVQSVFTLLDSTLLCSALLSSPLLSSVLFYSPLFSSPLLYSALLYSAPLYSTLLFSAIFRPPRLVIPGPMVRKKTNIKDQKDQLGKWQFPSDDVMSIWLFVH